MTVIMSHGGQTTTRMIKVWRRPYFTSHFETEQNVIYPGTLFLPIDRLPPRSGLYTLDLDASRNKIQGEMLMKHYDLEAEIAKADILFVSLHSPRDADDQKASSGQSGPVRLPRSVSCRADRERRVSVSPRGGFEEAQGRAHAGQGALSLWK